MKNIINLYSVPLVIHTQVYNTTDSDIELIKKSGFKKAKQNSVSESSNVLDDLKELSNIIDKYVDDFVETTLEIRQKVNRIASWSAISKKGEMHHNHSHPGTFLSAVFYAKCDTGNLVMTRPRSMLQDGFNFSYDVKKYNAYNCTRWELPLKSGDLVIFPGWLNHESAETQDNERIIVGANYFLSGQLGNEHSYDKVEL